MKPNPPIHRTFLVTMWQERGQDTSEWRYLLADAYSGEQQGFLSHEVLLTALRRHMTNLHNDAARQR